MSQTRTTTAPSSAGPQALTAPAPLSSRQAAAVSPPTSSTHAHTQKLGGSAVQRVHPIQDWLAKTWLGNVVAVTGLVLTLFGIGWAVYTGIVGVVATKWQLKNDVLQSCAALYVCASSGPLIRFTSFDMIQQVGMYSQYCNDTLQAGVLPPPIIKRGVEKKLDIRLSQTSLSVGLDVLANLLCVPLLVAAMRFFGREFWRLTTSGSSLRRAFSRLAASGQTYTAPMADITPATMQIAPTSGQSSGFEHQLRSVSDAVRARTVESRNEMKKRQEFEGLVSRWKYRMLRDVPLEKALSQQKELVAWNRTQGTVLRSLSIRAKVSELERRWKPTEQRWQAIAEALCSINIIDGEYGLPPDWE